MESFITVTRSKKRRTRRNLNEIKNRRKGTIFKRHMRNSGPTLNNIITENRLTGYKAVQSETVTRHQLCDIYNKTQKKLNNIERVQCLQTGDIIYDDSEKYTSQEHKHKIVLNEDKFESLHSLTAKKDEETRKSMSSGSYTSSLGNKVQSNKSQDFSIYYSEFMGNISNYLEDLIPEYLGDPPIINQHKIKLLQMKEKNLYNHTNIQIEDQLHSSQKPTGNVDAICTAHQHWKKKMLWDHSNSSSTSNSITSRQSTSATDSRQQESPDYVYYPHRLN